MNFQPYFKSPSSDRSVHHIRELYVKDDATAGLIGALVSSSLYFFTFFAFGNCRNLTLSDIKTFPVGEPLPENVNSAKGLFSKLMTDFQKNSVINTRGVTEFQEFNWGKSKPIIDQIDTLLAQHYDFTPEELDYIINYDIKYRMGGELDSREEGD